MVIKIRHIFIVLLILIIGVTITKLAMKNTEHFNEVNNETIYCVMVTGKDKSRLDFANIAIENFKNQSYPNKKLIIINEGDAIGVNSSNILEVKIDDRVRKGITLGDMRNMAFEFIPDKAIWTLWDDDDWRSDDYLSILHSKLLDNDYIMFTKRLEHNLNTGFTWTMELKGGFVIFFGRKHTKCEYAKIAVNEDIVLKNYIVENLKYKILNNEPRIYIRMVHKTNTSLLVNRNKQNIKDTRNNKLYYEYDATVEDKEYVKNVVKKKYNIIH